MTICYICTLNEWVYIQNDEMPWIIDVMGVFTTLNESIEFSKSFQFKHSEQWIELFEFNGTEKKEIAEISIDGVHFHDKIDLLK